MQARKAREVLQRTVKQGKLYSTHTQAHLRSPSQESQLPTERRSPQVSRTEAALVVPREGRRCSAFVPPLMTDEINPLVKNLSPEQRRRRKLRPAHHRRRYIENQIFDYDGNLLSSNKSSFALAASQSLNANASMRLTKVYPGGGMFKRQSESFHSESSEGGLYCAGEASPVPGPKIDCVEPHFAKGSITDSSALTTSRERVIMEKSMRNLRKQRSHDYASTSDSACGSVANS